MRVRPSLGPGMFAALLLAGAWWAGRTEVRGIVGSARAEPTVDVGGIVECLRLAIPAGDEVGAVLRADVQLSAGFRLMDRRRLPAEVLRAPEFDKQVWVELGAQAVIMNSETEGEVRIQLYDLSKGAAPVLSKTYPAADKRKAAHRFMNAVFDHYTGIPGAFGSRIAFANTRRSPSVATNIFTMEADGGDVVGVTANRSRNILPSLGPGGQVLFTSYAKRNPDLWMSDAAPPVRVSQRPGLNLGGVMSPTGDVIALALSKDGNAELYTIGTDGSVRERLTNNPAIDGSPTWSGSGAQLAFVSDRSGEPQVFRMSERGGDVSRITTEGNSNQSPDWSPGEGEYGQWIAYTGVDGSRSDVFSIHAKTGKRRRLTDSGHHTDPTWSPDGRMLAFSSLRGGIFVSDEGGYNPKLVMKNGATPDWGPRMVE